MKHARPLPALALASALLLAALGRAQNSVAERVVELGREDNQVMEHLDYLVNRIGPRLTSSTNLQRACEWTRQRFEAFGLEARLERWGEFPVGFDRRGASGGMVSPEQLDFVFGTQAWSAGTPGPVRGRAVRAPVTVEELEARRAELRGAWVVERPRDQRAASDVRTAIRDALATCRIAGEVRDGGDPIRTGGNHRVDPAALPTEVVVRLRRDHYQGLDRRLAEGQAVELEFDIDNRFLPGPVPQYNVIADLVGTEFPDEYVIVGGHIDSWDGATGTNDNGTGVATTLEAARLLAAAGAKPRRTIRFMLWGGEEQGLLGSRGWIEAHPELMEKISAVLVHDGGTNYLSGITATKAMAADLGAAMAPLAGLDPSMPFEVAEVDGLPQGVGSDHDAFLRAGVPGFFWRQSGRSDYDHVHHTQYDVWEGAIPEYQKHSAVVAALGALGIADLDHKLDRTEMVRPGGGRNRTRRVMGVELTDNAIDAVSEGGLAEKAGWMPGDVIVSVDGTAVANQEEIRTLVQAGGPRKVFTLRRGEQTLEVALDWTGTPAEIERERLRLEAEAKTAAEAPKAAGGAVPPPAPEPVPAGAGSGRP